MGLGCALGERPRGRWVRTDAAMGYWGALNMTTCWMVPPLTAPPSSVVTELVAGAYQSSVFTTVPQLGATPAEIARRPPSDPRMAVLSAEDVPGTETAAVWPPCWSFAT